MASAARGLLLARLRLRPVPVAVVASSCRILRPLAASRSPLLALPCLSPKVTVILRGFATQIEKKPLDTSDRPPVKVSSSNYCAGSGHAPIEDTTSSGSNDSDEHQTVTSGGGHHDITTAEDGGGDDEDLCYDETPRIRETRVKPGCDFNHWLVVMDPPPGEDPSNPDVPRDEIIDGYVKTLAQVVGSLLFEKQDLNSGYDEMHAVASFCVSETSNKSSVELPKVRWVLADSYLHAENKDYGGEPFINGKAVPYDPKYHEEWVKNTSRDNERTRHKEESSHNFDSE